MTAEPVMVMSVYSRDSLKSVFKAFQTPKCLDFMGADSNSMNKLRYKILLLFLNHKLMTGRPYDSS